MKAKFLMFMMVVGMLMVMPSISYAQYTEEELEYQGGDTGNDDYGPVSLEPEVVSGVFSNANQTITNTFHGDYGVVTIWIVDAAGNLYISEEVNTNTTKTKTISLKSLPAQKYTIICFTPEGQKTAKFELKK